MKLKDKLYSIVGYMLFLLVPFIAGLVIIFRDFEDANVEGYTFVINTIILVIISFVLYIGQGKWLPKISKYDFKYLIFGFIGNILIYFYTFQNALEIQRYITIYLIILLILFSKYFLFDHQFRHKELWIMMLVFTIIDSINLLMKCGYYDYRCTLSDYSEILLFSVNLLMFIILFLSFIYEIIRYKHYTLLKAVHVLLIIILIQFFLRMPNNDLDNKFYLTVLILVPFLIAVDYIYHFVTKEYYKELTFFYIRTITLLFISFFLGQADFFSMEPNGDYLAMMVVATYVIFFIHLFPEKATEKDIEIQFDKINIIDKLDLFNDLWSPKIIGELNNSYVKVAKIQGEYVWHKHEKEDELFYCLDGEIVLDTREKRFTLKKGEMIIVPKGVEHKPSSNQVSAIMMIELKSTRNTGNIINELTKEDLEKI